MFLAINASVVDAGKFSHMSGDWIYGDFQSNMSIKGTYVLASYLNAIDKTTRAVRMYQPRTEVLLTASVPIKDFLRSINVHPSHVEAIKQTLRENGISEEFIDLVQ